MIQRITGLIEHIIDIRSCCLLLCAVLIDAITVIGHDRHVLFSIHFIRKWHVSYGIRIVSSILHLL